MQIHLLAAFAVLLSACTPKTTTTTISQHPFPPNAFLSGKGGGIMDGSIQVGEATVVQKKGIVTIVTRAQVSVLTADGRHVDCEVKEVPDGWQYTFRSPRKVKKIGIYYQ